MHSFIPDPLTLIPYLANISALPLIGIGAAGTFVVQSGKRESMVFTPRMTVQRPIDPKH